MKEQDLRLELFKILYNKASTIHQLPDMKYIICELDKAMEYFIEHDQTRNRAASESRVWNHY